MGVACAEEQSVAAAAGTTSAPMTCRPRVMFTKRSPCSGSHSCGYCGDFFGSAPSSGTNARVRFPFILEEEGSLKGSSPATMPRGLGIHQIGGWLCAKGQPFSGTETSLNRRGSRKLPGPTARIESSREELARRTRDMYSSAMSTRERSSGTRVTGPAPKRCDYEFCANSSARCNNQ